MADWNKEPPIFQLIMQLSKLRLELEQRQLLARIAHVEQLAKTAKAPTGLFDELRNAVNKISKKDDTNG